MSTGMRDSGKLLVRAPNWLGDNVLALPAVAALRLALPNAQLTVLARPAVADLWRMAPIDRVMPLVVRAGLRGLTDRIRAARALRAEAFDAALVLPNSFDSALVPALARIPERAGWATDGRRMLLTTRIAYPRHLNETSQSQKYVYMVGQWIGRDLAADYAVRLQVPRDAAARVQAARQDMAPRLIGVNPGATYGAAKCWLPGRFAEVALRAHRERDAHIIVFGGPGDAAVCANVQEQIVRLAGGSAPWCVNLAGKTSLTELAAWLAACWCLVTNDTGAMHVAAAVGTRVVAVFGPTDWKTTAPLGTGHALLREPVACAPCLKRECPTDHCCMGRVTVDRVMAALSSPGA